MNRGTKSIVKGLMAAVIAAAAVPGVAMADRYSGRGEEVRQNYYDRHDERGRSGGGWINVDVRSGQMGRPPVFVDRTERVWVEPVYRTVCERVWVDPVYRTVCERVWCGPVVERRMERVWVPERRELREVRTGYCVRREWVVVPGHHENVYRDLVVAPGRYEQVSRQVLVSEGRWQMVERQELVSGGHWETRVERVAVAQPPVREGVRIDLRLPIRW